jgi:hypothetical protein
MAAILKLVLPQVSLTTVEVLTYLLSEAQAGRIVGLAYVAMHNQQNHTADVVGLSCQCPSLTRGVLKQLDDELADLVRR